MLNRLYFVSKHPELSRPLCCLALSIRAAMSVFLGVVHRDFSYFKRVGGNFSGFVLAFRRGLKRGTVSSERKTARRQPLASGQVMEHNKSRTTRRQFNTLQRILLRVLKSSIKRLAPSNRQALSRISPLVTLYRWALRLLVPRAAEHEGLLSDVFGFIMYLDPNDDTGCLSYYLSGNYEPATSAVFRQVLSEGDTVVDVGAHWGYYTLLAASLCGSRGRIFAFEPHPANFALLTKSVKANALTSVVTVQKAVSDCIGEAKLSLSRYSVGHSICGVPAYWSVSSDYCKDSLNVEVTSLDAFFPRGALRPRVVKIDVEGAEPRVLRGMHSLMESNSSLVLIAEYNPSYLDTDSVTRLVTALASYGCEVGVIDDDQCDIYIGPPSDVLSRILHGGSIKNMLATRDRTITQVLLDRQKRLGRRWVEWRPKVRA